MRLFARRLGLTLLALALSPAFLHAGAHAYFGAGKAPIRLSNFKAVELSDWQGYGLGAAEGRLALDLAPLNRDHYAPQLTAGIQGSLDTRLDLRLDLQATLDTDVALLDVGLAAPYKFFEHEGLSLALVPRFGYLQGLAELGRLQAVPGKSSTVILPNMTLKAGDRISAMLTAYTVSAGFSLGWKFMHVFGLQLDLGWTYADASAFELQAQGNTLDRKDKAVTQPGGGSASAGLHPSLQINGPNAALSVMVWVP